MSVYNNIRSGLEISLSEIDDIPPIQFQNVNYSAPDGIPFITCQLFPTSRRPSEVGSNPFNKYQGLFRVNVYTPENSGPRQNQDICNSIIDEFPAGTHEIEFNDQIIRVEFTEQLSSFQDSPWFITPINVGWYTYDKK